VRKNCGKDSGEHHEVQRKDFVGAFAEKWAGMRGGWRLRGGTKVEEVEFSAAVDAGNDDIRKD
jgi:hypothetical protein